jgi:hypothetical protein
MLRRHITAKICAAAILCSGGGVLAQTIYKQIDATRRTILTDRPTADGIVVPHVTFSSQQRGSLSPPRIETSTRSDVAKALFSNSAMTSIYAATVDFNEAARRLRQARQSRQEGMELWPGERADSPGARAMNKRYQRRQQKLEREIVAADLRLHETALIRSTLLERTAGDDDDQRSARTTDDDMTTRRLCWSIFPVLCNRTEQSAYSH